MAAQPALKASFRGELNAVSFLDSSRGPFGQHKGPCFVAEGPAERKQLRLKLLERNAEGTIHEASVLQHVRR
uniref:Uncharacterized protein n=1 Tax=Zea mays TaxID=4577 RepID=B6T8E8_MAIZE|nr:hypothetical protein [Zea mays]